MDKIPTQQVLPGNLTLLQAAEIANKHQLKIFMPATMIIGKTEYMHSKDRTIHTNPLTNELIVKNSPITILHVKKFIDKHMNSVASTPQVAPSRQNQKLEGVIAPKYVLKTISKNGESDTRVYYCKNLLISEMIENWGTVDLILQQFVIPKTLQATIYRFYRNEKNVFRTECIINKRSAASESNISQIF